MKVLGDFQLAMIKHHGLVWNVLAACPCPFCWWGYCIGFYCNNKDAFSSVRLSRWPRRRNHGLLDQNEAITIAGTPSSMIFSSDLSNRREQVNCFEVPSEREHLGLAPVDRQEKNWGTWQLNGIALKEAKWIYNQKATMPPGMNTALTFKPFL